MTPRVEIVQLDAAALRGLGDGDQAAAERTSPVPLSPYLAGPECRRVWKVRAEQVVQDPASAAWVTGVVWDPDRRLAVGRAGYHGPPDAAGMVEVGYSIDPQFRRQGYARAALRALLTRAEADPDVRTFRATISPDNVASRDLVVAHGLVEVGEQWDDEDGLEIVYEVPVDGARTWPA
ncbi:MAG TPA: GNAT family N-acetyltransferase [Blastococcus sp.]|nr:GNAT family N-acetyltransferase [Blastococcus sp.]